MSELAEAIEQFDTLTPVEVWPSNSFIPPIVDAARRVLEAEQVQWCETHGSSAFDKDGGCYFRGLVEESCSIVPKLLVPIEL